MHEQIGMALVNLYFEKKRGIANGITTTGTGVGILVFPPLTHFLFSHYGYQGTCIVLSAIALHGVIAGLVIITPDAALKFSMRLPIADEKIPGTKETISSSPVPFQTESITGNSTSYIVSPFHETSNS